MLLDYDPDDIDVQITELLIATADGADEALPPTVRDVLHMLRERMGMDVAFVSQIGGGRRTFRVVESRPDFQRIQAGMSDPVEESWCQMVVDGRLPELMPDAAPWIESGRAPRPGFAVGTHLSTPIRLSDGSVYGTLCCLSQAPAPTVGEQDLKRLRYTAQLLASKLDGGRPSMSLAH